MSVGAGHQSVQFTTSKFLNKVNLIQELATRFHAYHTEVAATSVQPDSPVTSLKYRQPPLFLGGGNKTRLAARMAPRGLDARLP